MTPRSRRAGLCARAFLFVCLVAGLIPALSAADVPAAPPALLDPAGPWLVRDTAHFSFIHRARDAAYVAELEACADDVYRTVTGLFAYAPKEKVPVIIRADQDNPPYGGVTTAMPLRIELVAASGHSPKDVLQHEFTHYVNGTRPSGLLWLYSLLFGSDYNIGQVSFQLHLTEGVTSLVDASWKPAYELFIRAPLAEQRMWGEFDIWNGGPFTPGALRVYLSQFIYCDWIYRHEGPQALARIQKSYAWFPFAGDAAAIRRVTGRDPARIWSEALSELAARYAADFARPATPLYTPQSSWEQVQWYGVGVSERGHLQLRTSLDAVPQLGFWVPPADDPAPSGPRLDRPAESGSWYPFEGVPVDIDGAAVSADGRVVVAAVADPLFNSDANGSNRVDLWRFETEAARRGWKAVGLRRLTTGAQLFYPTLSPDGSRLFALQRVSGRYRLVEVDQANGACAVLLDFAEPDRVVRVRDAAVSPDGSRLAIRVDAGGSSDIAMVALPPRGGAIAPDSLDWVTRDAAMDYAPRFLPDGRLAFVSDREDALVLYARNPDGGIVRLWRDRIGVLGVEPARDAYTAPDGARIERRAGLLYASQSAEGRVVRRLPDAVAAGAGEAVADFAVLAPSWVGRQQILERELQALSPASGAHRADAVPDAALASTVRPLVDIAVPRIWSPVIGYDLSGLRVGAMFQAFSLLGQNNWTLAAAWLPESNQAAAQAAVNLLFPGFSFGVSGGIDYQASESNSRFTYLHDRTVAAGASLVLAEVGGVSGDRFDLGLSASGGARWRASSNLPFDAVAAWNLPADFLWNAAAALNLRWWAPAPVSAYAGGPAFLAGAGFMLRTGEPGGWLSLEPRFGLGDLQLGLRARGAVAATDASALLGGLVSAWPEYAAPARFDLNLSLGIPSPLRPGDRFLYVLPTDKTALRLNLRSAAGVSAAGVPFWDGTLQAGLELTLYPRVYYNEIPIGIGVAGRIHINDGVANYFDPAKDFGFWLNLLGQRFGG